MKPNLTLLEKRYEIGDLLTITGMDRPSLNMWLIGESAVIRHLAEDPVKVRHRRKFSPIDVLCVVLIRRLRDFGLELRPSYAAASRFINSATTGRLPGHLFPTGRTLLVVTGSGAKPEPTARVVNAGLDTPLADTLSQIRASDSSFVLVVDLNAVTADVLVKLAAIDGSKPSRRDRKDTIAKPRKVEA